MEEDEGPELTGKSAAGASALGNSAPVSSAGQ